MSELGPDELERPVGLVITSVIGAAFALTWALKAPGTIGQFADMFRQFGADMPTITGLVLHTGWICWFVALPGLAIMLWIAMHSRITRQQFRQMKLAERLYCLVLGMAVATVAYALYAPIFRLGAVV